MFFTTKNGWEWGKDWQWLNISFRAGWPPLSWPGQLYVFAIWVSFLETVFLRLYEDEDGAVWTGASKQGGPFCQGLASSICYGPAKRLFIVARYTNTHSFHYNNASFTPLYNTQHSCQTMGLCLELFCVSALLCSLLCCVATAEENHQYCV